MNNTVEFVLQENGSLIRRSVSELPVPIADQKVAALLQDKQQKLTVYDMINHPEHGGISAVFVGGSSFWTVRMRNIPMQTSFRMVNEILVPVFTTASEIEVPAVWEIPEGMRVYLVIKIIPYEGGCGCGVHFEDSWLMTMDKENRQWRLPLPNLYEDNRICQGKELSTRHNSFTDAVIYTVNHFDKSRWNSDLLKSLELAQKMFRFKPRKDSGFDSVPPDCGKDVWQSLCQKVSNSVTDFMVL